LIKTDLSKYDNSWYKPGKPSFIRFLWYYVSLVFFRSGLFPFSGLKVSILRFFSANVGKGVIIKPHVNIKYPWKLKIGDHCWIGENSWIDNLGNVELRNNVCLSQGAMLLCGNHNFRKSTFDLIVGDIVLEDGVWIGAMALVGPGVVCHSHSVLAVKSVASSNLEAFGIYKGNPAVKIKERKIEQ
jgi:putative colanic acid biosynthesis acetyltransferase WcaF